MCAIIDANAAHEIFGNSPTEAGEKFRKWFTHGHGRIVVGGGLRRELDKTQAGNLLRQLVLSGRARSVNDDQVDQRAEKVRVSCKSNDPHVIALAQVSGARLLYSGDKDLHEDFGNTRLIQNPGGKIYSTQISGHFSKGHRGLLRRRDLCRVDNKSVE